MWNDPAIVITFNDMVWIGSMLYSRGGVDLKKVPIRELVVGFFGFVLLGLAFTLFKSSVLLEQPFRVDQVADAFFTVLMISALLIDFQALRAIWEAVGWKRASKKPVKKEDQKNNPAILVDGLGKNE